jgi:hypothetical protein
MIGSREVKRCAKCDCGEKRLIVNKRHSLCQEKNRERLDHNSGEERVVQRKLAAKSLTSNKGLSPGKKRLGLSKKKKDTNTSYKKVCEQIGEERGMECEGCGTHQRLSFSHLSPRSRRPDLIDDPRNIHIHCMDGDGVVGCHTKYEAGDWEELNDKWTIVFSLREIDPEYLRIKTMNR